jgi:hypothetical protein
MIRLNNLSRLVMLLFFISFTGISCSTENECWLPVVWYSNDPSYILIRSVLADLSLDHTSFLFYCTYPAFPYQDKNLMGHEFAVCVCFQGCGSNLILVFSYFRLTSYKPSWVVHLFSCLVFSDRHSGWGALWGGNTSSVSSSIKLVHLVLIFLFLFFYYKEGIKRILF